MPWLQQCTKKMLIVVHVMTQDINDYSPIYDRALHTLATSSTFARFLAPAFHSVFNPACSRYRRDEDSLRLPVVCSHCFLRGW